MNYQIYKYEKIWGPYDEETIRNMIYVGQVSINDLTSTKGKSDWTTVQNKFFGAEQLITAQPKTQIEYDKKYSQFKKHKNLSFCNWKTMSVLMGLITVICFLAFKQPAITQDERLIRQAIGEILNKPSSELIQEDFNKITRLSIHSEGLLDISLIGNLPNLEELELPHNQIKELGPLRNLKSLEYLNLAGNRITDLDPIMNLPKLKILHLGGNSLSGIGSLKNLKNVKELDLGDNQIENLMALVELPNLEVVNLTGNQIQSIDQLLPLKQLKLLVFENATNFSKQDRSLAQANTPYCSFIW